MELKKKMRKDKNIDSEETDGGSRSLDSPFSGLDLLRSSMS